MTTKSSNSSSEKQILLGSAKNLVQSPVETIRSIKNRNELSMARDLALGVDYNEANRIRMDKRIRNNPRKAIGGDDLGIGIRQFEFLKSQGLSKSDKLLDLGCGTLRAGEYFIKFLDVGNYYGVDISPEAIKYSSELVRKNGLEGKEAVLKVNNDFLFDRLKDVNIDFVIANSVFTHLPPTELREFFENIDKVLADDGEIFLTFWKNRDVDSWSVENLSSFKYSANLLNDIAFEKGFMIEELSSEFSHPRGQSMFKFTKPDSNSEAACFGCGRKTFVESKYFDKKWEAGVSHSEDRVQRNAVYCGDCQEHRFYGQSLAERILVFLDATIGRVDRKIQRKVGGFFA